VHSELSAVYLVDGVAAQVNGEIEVTRRSSSGSGLAFAFDPNLATVGYSGGDLDVYSGV
jgi:hypothetical protein